jgi:hypothetical protein
MTGAAIVIVIGAVTFACLVVFALALMKQVRVLTASLRRFQEEVRPALEQIQAASGDARARSERVSDRAAKIREGSTTPGARLRP